MRSLIASLGCLAAVLLTAVQVTAAPSIREDLATMLERTEHTNNVTARQEDYYILDDISKCILPTTDDVPIDYIPALNGATRLFGPVADSSNPRIRPLDAPDYEMWRALRMTEWLHTLLDGCPAARFAVCNGNERCHWSRSMAMLLVGAVRRNADGLPTYAEFECDRTGCTWPDFADSADRGGVPAQGRERPTLPINASPAQILKYRRWYAFVAMRAVWIHLQTSRQIMETGAFVGGLGIQEMVTQLMATGTGDNTPAFSLRDVLPMINAFATFIPGGRSVQIIFGVVEALTNRPVASVFGIEPRDAFDEMANLKDESDLQMGRFLVRLSRGVGAFTRFLPSNNDPARESEPEITPARMQAFFTDLFAESLLNLGAQTDAVLRGDPLADGGFMSYARTGMFSELGAPSELDIGAASLEYAEYIKETVAMKIYELNRIWLYRQTYLSEAACNTGLHPSVRGQACVLENGFWRLYLPMTWRETELTGNRAHGVQYRGSFEGLTANRMRAVNVNFTQRAVFTRSHSCHLAAQQSFLQGHGHVCRFDQPVGQYDSWPAERPARGPGRNARDAECHINIPVLDINSPVVARGGCTNPWYSTQSPAECRSNTLQNFCLWRTHRPAPTQGNFHWCAPWWSAASSIVGPAQRYAEWLFYPIRNQCLINPRWDSGPVMVQLDTQVPPPLNGWPLGPR